MPRMTIDFGIDLGTTNSEIALWRGRETEVFKNNEGFEYTSSAVWIDKQNRLFVGRRAKERLEDDSDNAFSEFKLQMGTAREYQFTRSGRRMKPEELSAEVLKGLRNDVKQRTGEDVEAAVITVPAAFELPQCEATKRAAQLAGIAVSPLLQEPAAAALVYGFQNKTDKVFWLAYDLGGGTFDAAIIQVRDGVILIVNHEGDNQLGGKLIDWEIVEQLLMPAVLREHRLSDFRRGNAKWRAAIAKLKLYAEQAKIRVSRDDSAEIVIDYLCQDDRGEAVRFEYELKRSDVERLTQPFILRSINICKKALADKHLGIANVEKVLLVGGPTLMPYLKEYLSDPKEGLGIPLVFSEDPMTIVARGAAIFAGNQRIEGIASRPVEKGQYPIELDYKPMGANPEPLVGGRIVMSGGENPSSFTIEFVNSEAQPPWRSGKIPLSSNGAFTLTLLATEGSLNTFLIELCDESGKKVETVPDRITYSIVGIEIPPQPLLKTVGIALANNEVLTFFHKGQSLPARHREVCKTVLSVRKDQGGDLITIPVIEGENRRADRNTHIGSLVISGNKIKRDVPAGSDVEITIHMDPSRLLRTKAYIPILDEEYEKVITLQKQPLNFENLEKEIDQEKKRLEDATRKTQTVGDLRAQAHLQRIEREKIIHDIDSLCAASKVDPDAADKCEKRLLDLKLAIDEFEQALEWPALLQEADEETKMAREAVQRYGSSSDKQTLLTLEKETQQAKQNNDPDVLRRKINELSGLRWNLLRERPEVLVSIFHQLEEMKATMGDRPLAEQLINQGNRSINANDIAGLKAAVRQLFTLLPVPDREKVEKGYGSRIII